MKSILLIGLGRFGTAIARKMAELGQQVMAIDRQESRVNAALGLLTNAQIGDSTREDFLRSLGVPDFDECIVAIGDDFQSSLETTALLKELGARHVIARAAREVHEKFLLRNGADEVVYPERQVAEWTAIRAASEKIFDYFALGGDYAIFELAVPPHWVGRSVAQLDIRRAYQVNVLALKHGAAVDAAITPATVFTGEETMLVLGRSGDVLRHFPVK